MNNILHLVLKHKWYDMIESGVKREEYRQKTPYWNKRLNKSFDAICFHKGYTNITQTFMLKEMLSGLGIIEWGAPENESVYILKLGKKIDSD